ncbi:universal stress protein [Sneathiella chinensis]|uniref:Universal stress protein YxiE n=1 Tax=Sneathiella chinensis TaxID=349750 RepID=A0ABQ5TZR2_9PROT|nr:universal stress protein [Sneathiella chinensis]GLQ05099.1 universal stress protein YxiE [Sneathiella chinensis]
MIEKILIPLDGSSHADRAAALGLDLAAKYQARVILLNVFSRTDEDAIRHLAEGEHMIEAHRGAYGDALSTLPVEGVFRSSYLEQEWLPVSVYEQIGNAIMEHARQEALKKGVADLETRVEGGNPADRIVELAKSEGADLIVMGCRGLGRLKSLIMGSVSHKVSQVSPCSYLVVK